MVKDNTFGFLLILPSLLLLLLLVIFPVGYVLYLSMHDFTTAELVWTGFSNYKEILFSDGEFWPYTFHSIEYVFLAIGSAFLIGLLVALSLNTINKFKGTLRTMALWAWAIPPVIASLMWKWILNDTNGVINDILLEIGLISNPIPWLSLPHVTMIVLSQVHTWTVIPFIMVILLAGLQSIPSELYEAASIDGANSLNRFQMITFPMLKSSILTSVMISSIFAFRTIDIVFTLTRGGPGEATQMLVTYIYDKAFIGLRLGYAAALSVIMVVISMLMVTMFVSLIKVEDI
jgi:ABC-type sugar transport system permease subunit